MQGSDFAALRKLRDESECDELKEAWSSEDPREWKNGGGKAASTPRRGAPHAGAASSKSRSRAAGRDRRMAALTTLKTLARCSNLAALPAASGELTVAETGDGAELARPSRCRPRSVSSKR